jgi:hypothetical protein
MEYVAENNTSILLNGTQESTVYQQYQGSITAGRVVADSIVEIERYPETRIDKIYCCANASPSMMYAFMHLGIGDMIRLKSTQANTDALYYIQGREWEIKPGGIIFFNWIVKEALTLGLGLSLIGMEVNTGGETGAALTFGTVPHLSNIEKISASAWINLYNAVGANGGFIVSNFSDSSGWTFYVKNTKRLAFYQKGAGGAGRWETADNVFAYNTWTHVAVSRDTALPGNLPKIYVNGVEVTVTETNPQTGAVNDEIGNAFMIGNTKTASYDYSVPFYGRIQNVRIYEGIIYAGEVAAIYGYGRNSTNVVSGGLLFLGPVVPTRYYQVYNNNILDANHNVLDAIHQVVGKQHGIITPITYLP